MQIAFIKKNFYLIIVFVVMQLQSQEVPPIEVFTPQDYGAEDQNWSISQSKKGFIYVANNKGLLEYNGAKWKLYNSTNDGILRSVEVVNDRIYTGGYRDFGYWTENNLGHLDYTSLTNKDSISVKEDEEFWGIIELDEYVLFQSLERIYVYNTIENNFNIIESDLRINKMFKVDGVIYFQKGKGGIYSIENGKAGLYISSAIIDNKEIVNIYDLPEGVLLLTKDNGFIVYNNNEVSKWNISSDKILSGASVYSSARLVDGSFILGTISNGILHLDKDGDLLLNINQSTGLSNNTVLSLKEDVFGNVWLGLDNGINIINLNSPYSVYTDKQGVLGTVYASAKNDGYLYLGTNQGLFYKRIDLDSEFQFVTGTQGQVWSLELLDDELFCGHDNGTFIIRNTEAEKISSEKGTWSVKKIVGYPKLLIQSNYKGFNILQKTDNGSWMFRNKIIGFDISSRFFEFISSNEVLVSHEHKGVFKLKIDADFRKVLSYVKLPIKEGIKSSVFKFNNQITYSYKGGVHSYDSASGDFDNNSVLSDLFSGQNYISGKVINDDIGNRIWGFNIDDIIYIEPGKLSGEPEIKSLPISLEIRGTKPGYENVLYLDKDRYLIGTTNGYLIVETDKFNQVSHDIIMNNISYTSAKHGAISAALNEQLELGNSDNSIRFNYSVTNFNKLLRSHYQYRLIGMTDEWSSWLTSSEVFFENLPSGDYNFQVRSKVGDKVSNSDISFEFSISKPWYLKPLALAVYAIFILVSAYAVHFFNKKYYKNQKEILLRKKERELELEQLEGQKQLMQFKNKNLQQDIENKNRELGMATMNLVKRNELLNNIKDELSKSKSISEVKTVIKLINSSLNDSNDWKLFEEAFNGVDKDFMKKIKALHPTITPNDLRLCAYLRLNLSSKEIAPLLNISHKSVEVKRYRLRKKMDLNHEQSLSNYIIEL